MNALTLPYRAAILTALIPLMLSCMALPGSAQDTDPNNAAFVTLLGNDTLAVERFVWTPTRMEADVVLRTPNHRASLCAGDGRDRRIAAIRAPSEPAGEYTLYSIPTEKGGLLLINTQTGQGGTTYNEDRDLGRVDLTRTTLHESVEVFTIRVEETEEGGVLKLQWGMTELSVPFGVE